MADYKPRVSVFSHSGPPPAFEPGEKELSHLEKIYGCPLSKEARESLIFLSDSFLRSRKAELNSEKYSEVRKQFELCREAVQAFQSFAYGAMTPQTDSGVVLSGKINSNLRDYPVSIRAGQIVADPSSPEWSRVEEARPLAIRMDANFVMNVGFALARVMAAVDKEISVEETEKGGGFTPGNAFKDFLLQMRKWAQDNDFIYGPLDSTQAPSSFSKFLFALNKLFPKEFREQVSSPGGVAERLRDVVRDLNAANGGR